MNVLGILLFIISLSLLIMVHELGHLTVAKIFKVYCQEFSIGMGPKLFSFKKKDKETRYSLRAIPFGGYVAMVDEAADIEEGISVPKERTLEGIKKWKKILILFAGVFMNCILAILLFFVGALIPRNIYYINSFNITENSEAMDLGLDNDTVLLYESFYDAKGNIIPEEELDTSSIRFYLIDSKVELYNQGNLVYENVYAFLDQNKFTDFTHLDISYFLSFYQSKEVEGKFEVDFLSPITLDVFTTASIDMNFRRGEEEKFKEDGVIFTVDNINGGIKDFGMVYFNETVHEDFIGAVKKSFLSFGQSSTLIGRTLVSLLVDANAWGDIGGIVAIGAQSTSTLSNLGFAYYLILWGNISVNLAIVNLLPFPGLDGWQILVTLIEGISRKKVPEKAKTIVSIVGLGLLFAFMIVIVIKDIVMLVG